MLCGVRVTQSCFIEKHHQATAWHVVVTGGELEKQTPSPLMKDEEGHTKNIEGITAVVTQMSNHQQ